MYNQTLCFVKRNNELLMLNREYAPMQGLWNGVGGKMTDGESPLECIVREIEEETGITVPHEAMLDKGVITWVIDNHLTGGLYVFQVNLDKEYTYTTPRATNEGILDWKKLPWLLTEDNFGVGEMLPHYLPILLGDNNRYHHHCTIEKSTLTAYKYSRLEAAPI
ncbi:NUDIX hydrolase [Gracilibacillus alcaliphilus]|uniref:NUDIX hydrolase n=1 Tax=Gracilibacillus alcaliphilus TaxID=1401441 RepID=UPI00195AB845|nr:8-oxo-dGTP diphosphatase [Gracilibacillus alcaliphilus]MBM7677083.1 8-oxo-dGTP diphosphatase [Gracilibacillus alcaliphilus]